MMADMAPLQKRNPEVDFVVHLINHERRRKTVKTHEVSLVVRRALENARSAGLSYIEQNEHAVQALSEVNPSLTGMKALEAVNMIRRADRHEAHARNRPTNAKGEVLDGD